MATPTNTARRPRRQRLTDAIVRQLDPTPPRIVYDADLAGFGIRLSPTSRSWVLNYSLNRRERRLTIGAWPTWNAKQARARAMELRREIDQGRDPLQQRQAERAAAAMGELLDLYLEQAKSKRSIADDRTMIGAYIKPRWQHRKVIDITSDEVESLHLELTKAGKPVRANRVLSLLSTVFALAIKRKMRADNPCAGCSRNREVRRERHLSPAELARLLRVLTDWPNRTQAGAVRMALLSGSRRGEILSMEWSHIDLAEMAWRKPVTKNGRPQTLPISPEIADVLAGLPHTSKYVFPNGRNRPMSEVRDWSQIRVLAGISDCRFHDLRHTSASLMLAAGASLELISGVLHHSDTRMSQRYAHWTTDGPLRAAVNGLGKVVSAAAD
jgi:integrase